MSRQAVVMSGGGADGAYGVGVMKALAAGASPSTDQRPFAPEIFTGTSAGAFNAVYLVAAWEDYGSAAVSRLERVWLDRLASRPDGSNGLYRLRGDPLTLADPRSYFPDPLKPLLRSLGDGAVLGWEGLQRAVEAATAEGESIRQRLIKLVNLDTFVSREPFERLLNEVIDYQALSHSKRILRIIATNWLTGELHLFRRRDLCSGELGPLAILASSSVPGMFPPTLLGSQQFVDGGVLLNTPLKPALEAGATELHVIYLDPDVKNIELSSFRSTVETLYRMNQISWAAAMNDDIEDAESINVGLDLLRRIQAGEPLDEQDADIFITAAGHLSRSGKGVSRYKPLTIHRYHPREDSSGELGFLNLQRNRLERLIERGFRDAATHDCAESECVLPNQRLVRKTDAVDRAVRGFGGTPAAGRAP